MAEARVEPNAPIASGSRVTQVRLSGGRRDETRYLVESVEADRALLLRSLGVKPASTIRYQLSTVPEGAQLSCAIRVETGGLLRLVESRLRGDLDRKLGDTLESFKQSMEAG